MCVGEGGRSVHVREEGVCEGGVCVCEGGRSVYSRMYMSLHHPTILGPSVT